MEKGATHYAHVFYPLTHLTAEKHDSFFEPGGDGSAIAEFAGKTLTQGEPDASSFPNGGLRTTFEARGYTGWDVTSPAYILENPNGNTLCIPTVFISMTGEALDNKTPLLRSQQAMARQAARILQLFGHDDPDAVVSFAGAEQEYFLVDRSFFFARPDLLNAGRTLFGAKPPKGQEFDDHYFGAIPERVLAFMMDCERELFKLGIPAKTRHNEVAPGQFELAPDVRTFQRRGGPSAAAHDDPQAGRPETRHGVPVPREAVRGNQRLGQARQLFSGQLDPGQPVVSRATPRTTMPSSWCFVPRSSERSTSSAACCGPRWRRPPTITASGPTRPRRPSSRSSWEISWPTSSNRSPEAAPPPPRRRASLKSESIPSRCSRPIPGTATGPARSPSPATASSSGPRARCNRSPARWSPSTPSWPRPSITSPPNSRPLVAGGTEFNAAVQSVLEEIIKDHGAVVFNDDGYADDWQVEAAERGLPNLKTTLDALPELITEESIELFSRYGVFNHREMHSRYDIALEQYILSIDVEAALTLEMATTVILPAAMRYQTELALNASSLSAIGHDVDSTTLNEVSAALGDLRKGIATLRAEHEHGHTDSEEKRAVHAQKALLPAMASIRVAADQLETLVADDLWPLPTYQEMLFIL